MDSVDIFAIVSVVGLLSFVAGYCSGISFALKTFQSKMKQTVWNR